jgi:hypothetical protein
VLAFFLPCLSPFNLYFFSLLTSSYAAFSLLPPCLFRLKCNFCFWVYFFFSLAIRDTVFPLPFSSLFFFSFNIFVPLLSSYSILYSFFSPPCPFFFFPSCHRRCHRVLKHIPLFSFHLVLIFFLYPLAFIPLDFQFFCLLTLSIYTVDTALK